jgi:hypothetical protein
VGRETDFQGAVIEGFLWGEVVGEVCSEYIALDENEKCQFSKFM